jgi:hypothetical protein
MDVTAWNPNSFGLRVLIWVLTSVTNRREAGPSGGVARDLPKERRG